MIRLLAVVIVSVFIILANANANAQGDGQPNKRAIGFGLGFGEGRMSVGHKTDSNFCLNLLAQIGIDTRNRFLLVTEIFPLKVDNPVINESFSAANFLLALNVGGRFKVRPSLGLQFRFWSGSQRVNNIDLGGLIGIDAGYEIRRTENFSLSPELFWRWTMIEFEGGVTTGLMGLQIVGSWRK
jgi:hypothetical protein